MAEFVWKIGGEAGMGIMASGLTMCKAFTRGGLSVVGYPEYPSLVRGGENTFQIRVSHEEVHSPLKSNHLVVCLNRPTVDFHKEQIAQGGAIIYDGDSTQVQDGELRSDIKKFSVPFLKLATENGGDMIMRNTVALGASIALMGYDIRLLEQVLSETFAKKGQAVVEQNVKIAKAGYDYVLSKYALESKAFLHKISKSGEKKRMVMSGNEAIALGAAAGGLKFYSVYPMTPSSTIMHYLAQKELDFDVLVKQTEDEIAAVLYASGASFAGVRAATGTSGGGFSLMVEGMGMAAMAETPLTIFLAQRTGPSTGMPTWTEQADLKFALNASQGEFPRVIIAPGDLSETFTHTAKALNIAEKYQLPVIVLSDKYLSETYFSCEKFDVAGVKIERGKTITGGLKDLPQLERYKRYAFTRDGISPRPIPGVVGGMHVASSYEHDERGFSVENFATRKAMVDKRAKKLEGVIKNEIEPPKLYGPQDAEVSIICWGSQKGIAFDSMEMLKKEGVIANVLHFIYMFPLNSKSIKKIFKGLGKSKKVMIENNSTGQLAGVLREYAGVKPDFLLLKYDARQFFPEEVAGQVKALKDRSWKGKKIIRLEDKFAYDYLQAIKVLD